MGHKVIDSYQRPRRLPCSRSRCPWGRFLRLHGQIKTTRIAPPSTMEAPDLSLETHEEALAMRDSYGHLEHLLELIPEGTKANEDWFRLLGEWWSSCDGMHRFRYALAKILQGATRRELDAIMDQEEMERFKELPETIRAYRGCDLQDRDGLSFSLSYDMAQSFPFRHRYRTEWPAVFAADIPKSRAVLKLCREEDEIIVSMPELPILEIKLLAPSLCGTPLKSVVVTNPTFPQRLQVLHKGLFQNCIGLTEVNIPQGVVWIRESVFEGCTNLTRVMLPKSIRRIDKWAFRNCTALKHVEIFKRRSKKTVIAPDAFEGCPNLPPTDRVLWASRAVTRNPPEVCSQKI